jgi:hypothetical protein
LILVNSTLNEIRQDLSTSVEQLAPVDAAAASFFATTMPINLDENPEASAALTSRNR